MYKGVLRDDEKRREKKKQREAEFIESMRKREVYERVQPVTAGSVVVDSNRHDASGPFPLRPT